MKFSSDLFIGFFACAVLYTFVYPILFSHFGTNLVTIISAFCVLIAWIMFSFYKWENCKTWGRIGCIAGVVAICAGIVAFIIKVGVVG